MKLIPLCIVSKVGVEAELKQRGKISDTKEIAQVRIQTVSAAVRLMAGDPEKWTPTTRETADHSMPYTVAVALIYGSVAEHHFSGEYLHDPKIRALSQRVKVEVSEEAERHMPQAMRCIF